MLLLCTSWIGTTTQGLAGFNKNVLNWRYGAVLQLPPQWRETVLRNAWLARVQLELHLVVLFHAVFAAFLHVRQLDPYLPPVIRLFEDIGHVHLRRVVRDTQRGNVRQAVAVGRRWLEAGWSLSSMSSGDAARGLVH